MTANTGRTVGRWIDFRVDDSGGTLRSIPISSINDVGLDYEQVNMTALQDAIIGALSGQPSAPIIITGPFDTAAAAVAPTLSGSHTVLAAIDGGNTPLSLGVFIGMRHAWESGEPVFGITSTAANGYLCRRYTVSSDGMYSAEFHPYPGSAAPAWGTTAIT